MADLVTVLSTNGVKEAILALLPRYESETGRKVAIVWASTKAHLEKIAQGARADLYVLTDEAIDELANQGLVARGSRHDLARSYVGIAIPKGARKPDIRTPESLKQALMAARTIVNSRQGVSGLYLPIVLDRLGIRDEIDRKTTFPEGEPVGAVLARGEADLGFQQISELLAVAGIDIVGPLPDELQKVTVFSLGLAARAAAQADSAAADLARFLASEFTPALLKPKGLDPA